MNNVFSQQLVNLRRQNNWSQSELAEKLFVSRQAISKWEMGTSEPDIDKLIQLSQLFNSDLDFLIVGKSIHKNQILSVNNLSKAYEYPVLKKINFTVHSRERIALLGSNGAGKSTLINLILSQQQPDTGDIELKLNPKEDLNVMKQEDNLLLACTVWEQIALVSNMMNNYSQEKITQWLKQFNLEKQMKTKVNNLSGGQKRRLSLLLSLIRPSKLLILDEPTAGMDLESIDMFWQSLDYVSGSVLTVTHDFNQIDKYFSRVLLLKNGEIYADSSVDKIHSHNQTIEQWYRQLNKEN
ncbi:XRE family transcriptional regulator [Holzapfeliella floricola]|uniref:ABC transporter ATPase n=1 Tax=Holzapfeliella floricola DSM 23037 = JCM 16512 TaxID=1423744 RepID=A0A0R2DKU6_9LACO|nr:XRE family transcriptional regulator [Holzapfeliella floricola]KRN04801.1 ABC transporter ATPase [Holzapfeliella floricola DSM 23037 = JCM 16512]